METNTSPSPRSRWLRFSLRSLFLLMTVVSIVGYQQYRIWQLQESVSQHMAENVLLQQQQSRLQLQAQVARYAAQTIQTKEAIDPGLAFRQEELRQLSGQLDSLLFPIEIERAMMMNGRSRRANVSDSYLRSNGGTIIEGIRPATP